MENDKKLINFIKTTIREFLNENITNRNEIIFSDIDNGEVRVYEDKLITEQ